MPDRCEPLVPVFDNDFHEVWWDSIAGGEAPKGKLQVQLHEVWQWMGDAMQPAWRRPGESEWLSAEAAYEEGWRYVRKIELLDGPRHDGVPPPVSPSCIMGADP